MTGLIDLPDSLADPGCYNSYRESQGGPRWRITFSALVRCSLISSPICPTLWELEARLVIILIQAEHRRMWRWLLHDSAEQRGLSARYLKMGLVKCWCRC